MNQVLYLLIYTLIVDAVLESHGSLRVLILAFTFTFCIMKTDN